MCLYVNPKHGCTRKSLKAGIADKHYVVYKVVKFLWPAIGYITPYRNVPVVFGRLNRSRIKIYGGERVTIVGNNSIKVEDLWIMEGLHSCRTLKAAADLKKEDKNKSIRPAIIPKGSELYYGVDGDVVSNKLIIFENNEAMNKWLSEH